MEYVVDLHLHSKYSRAVSQEMTFPTMARIAKQKGLNILSASDFTHPLWLKEMKMQFTEKSEGLYGLKNENFGDVLFMMSTEISSIYSQDGKLRRIHNLVFAPSIEVVEKINQELIKRGCNLNADGRPIIGLSSMHLLELILSIDERCMLIPCHVWTPHFGIYGSASGFDSLSEAFGKLADNIYGIETGLSSDPEMNWQIPELKNRSILSFSDAHSPAKMGRECTVLELQAATYTNIKKAFMRTSMDNRVKYSIEFYPEEGKYHFSGHRNCKVIRGPEEIRTDGNMCPVCKRRLTEGVLFRVQQLADESLATRISSKLSPHNIKWYVDNAKTHPPFVKLVPLNEIIAESVSTSVASIKVKTLFSDICNSVGPEIEILLKTPIENIEKFAGPRVADGVRRVRSGNIVIDPGYDGEYGHVKIWPEGGEETTTPEDPEEKKEQLGLF